MLEDGKNEKKKNSLSVDMEMLRSGSLQSGHISVGRGCSAYILLQINPPSGRYTNMSISTYT